MQKCFFRFFYVLKYLPAGFFKVKAPDWKNVFAADIVHLIPCIPFISSMSSWVTNMMNRSPLSGDIPRRSFLLNWILPFPSQVKLTP